MNIRNGNRNRVALFMACAAAVGASAALAAPRQRQVKNVTTPPRMKAKATYDLPAQIVDRGRLVPLNTPRSVMRAGAAGSVSAVPVTVYRNGLAVPPTLFYPPGARCAGGTATNIICTSDTDCPGSLCKGDRMSDDFQLASGACSVLSYLLRVVALPESPGGPNPAFDVHTELWDGDPCVIGSAVIAGTEMDFAAVVPNDVVELIATLPAAVAVPERVWLSVEFSSNNAGWIGAEEAELGFTGDVWSEDNRDALPSVGCLLLSFGGAAPIPYAGFWASVDCESVTDPTGACCNGETCGIVTEAACTTGVWQGPFTKCDPSPCRSGACCSGFDFRTCGETTEAGCTGDQQLFSPGDTCNPSPCQPGFTVYENNFDTGIFGTIDVATTWADKLELGPGVPCDLLAYEVIMVADVGAPPYAVSLALWTDDDGGTPTDPADDQPLAAILPTRTIFNDVPGDLTRKTLLAGPFSGITLPDEVWFAIQTDSALAGPLLGGDPADVGASEDFFAVFDGAWGNGFNFGGHDPTGCPGAATCVPAANFRIKVWCRGETPRGACCNPAAGTCVDNVLQAQCHGRWSQDKLCSDPTAFPTPCNRSACCDPFAGCIETDPTTCASFGGSFVPGASCADSPCVEPACFGAVDDCSGVHGTPGCDDLLCCQSVCAVDPNCCVTGIGWDAACTEKAALLCTLPPANDHCVNAEPISGVGTFAFDNSTATTDGPPQTDCVTVPESDQVANDVWYCWTATCNDVVHVQTCGLTDVDSKIAVYPGCGTCPPGSLDALACNDDFCGFDKLGQQSQVTFTAVAGQSYSIRVGTFPGGANFPEAAGGPGEIKITCGTPSNAACAAGAGDCCGDTGSAGCEDTSCCNQVCLCDPFCCEVDWDANCAGGGAGSSGCGAAVLCTQACGSVCEPGTYSLLDPVSGVVDARQPHEPGIPTVPQGFDRVVVGAPAGADRAICWEACADGMPNDVVDVLDNGDGTLTLVFTNAITANAVTTVTYVDNLGNRQSEPITAHSGNVNGSALADSTDVVALANCLTSGLGCPLASCDADRSGSCAAADILRLIDLMEGANGFSPNDGTPLPTEGQIMCP